MAGIAGDSSTWMDLSMAIRIGKRKESEKIWKV
jgi:hypothetical protein